MDEKSARELAVEAQHKTRLSYHEKLSVHVVQSELDRAPRSAEVWIVDKYGKAYPVSSVFRELGEDGRVYIVARPWLHIEDDAA